MVDGRTHTIDIVRRRPHLVVTVDGREHEVSATGQRDDGRQAIEIAGVPYHFIRAHVGERQVIHLDGRNFETSIRDRGSESELSDRSRDVMKAPMPGAVVSVHKHQGAAIKRGDTIVTIESMKLQMALQAQRDGIVAAVLRQEGDTFDKDEVIVRLEPLPEER
jgi:3-methylcrotonyl-CoA carboxylase alpha subunit